MNTPSFFQTIITWQEKSARWLSAHPATALHLLILFGLIVRIIRLGIEDFQPRDAYFYLLNAEIIANEGWAVFYQTGVEAYKNMPPGFFLLLQGGTAIGLSLKAAGFLLLFVSYLILTYAVYFGIKVLWNDRHYALLGVLFAATSPWLVRYSVYLVRDMPYYACGAAALASGASAVTREKYRYWILFAFFSVGAILLRKEGFELLMVFGVWCAFSLLIQLIRRRWRSALFSLTSAILVALLTLLPLLALEHYFRVHFSSTWEVIPTTWAGFIWSMFQSLLKR